ncbi:MAG TPA: VOC family protein [Gemmatimonadales bacterium]|jgi:glyoxalase family protein
MTYPILGLHHVTATVDDAQADLDFCLDALGLRLVKRTVNFDNHSVYHFYYGNDLGRPGTIWTTFPYKGRGVPVGEKGTGQVTATSFSVPASSLDYWRTRLRKRGVTVDPGSDRFGEESIAFADPSGLVIELVGSDRDERTPWTKGGIAADAAIRGLYGVTLTIRAPEPTLELMTGLLGFEVVNRTKERIRLTVNGDQPGHAIDILAAGDAGPAKNGLGTVHHVAMAIAEPDQQLRLRQELVDRGYRVTEVLDRQYFQSIYFREPGGVLFEVATVRPGFTVDEDPSRLGCDLKLPPWEERNRPVIEEGLPRIEVPVHR